MSTAYDSPGSHGDPRPAAGETPVDGAEHTPPLSAHPASASPRAQMQSTGWSLTELSRWQAILLGLITVSMALRLPMLHRPTDQGTPVFDEKHYAPQAWQILRGWAGPFVGGIEDNPGFGLVVHPPLAKQLEALGMALFGYTPMGWRIVIALLGIAVIVLIASTARRIAGSDIVGLIAGIVAMADGILFVTGRSAMLDHVQTFFIIAAAYCGVRDAEQVEQRFRAVYREGRVREHPLGPRMGYRWWRFATGLALGMSLSVKWSGLYYMAAAGLLIVLTDYLRRRRYGVAKPLRGTAVLDIVPSFAAMVILPALLYLLNFRAWFASTSSAFRYSVKSGEAGSFGQDTLVRLLPESVQNFLFYHHSVLEFHTSLTNSRGHMHPWESKPWSWLVSSRGLLYYSPDVDSQGMRHVVLLVGTPAVWWPCVPIMLWGLWCLVIRRDGRWTIPLVGFSAGFFPWLMAFDRQMYLFYAVNLAPFLVIGFALVAQQLLAWRLSPVTVRDLSDVPNWKGRLRTVWREHTGAVLVAAYVFFIVWNFLFFLPIYTAMPVSSSEWAQRIWLPSWI